MSKTNKEKTFGVTEEPCTLIKSGSDSDRKNEKWKARSVFSILNEQTICFRE